MTNDELMHIIDEFEQVFKKLEAYCSSHDTCETCGLSGWLECPYRYMLDSASQLLSASDNLEE